MKSEKSTVKYEVYIPSTQPRDTYSYLPNGFDNGIDKKKKKQRKKLYCVKMYLFGIMSISKQNIFSARISTFGDMNAFYLFTQWQMLFPQLTFYIELFNNNI